MKNLINSNNLSYRFQQLIILILHLILLKWMYFVLSNSGAFSITEVFYHFTGMSIMGAVLIRGCAYWARCHYLKELKANEIQNDQQDIQDIQDKQIQ